MFLLRLAAPIVTIALIAVMAMWVDRVALVQAFSHVSISDLGLGLVLVQLQIMLSALRWRFTAARLGQPIALNRAIGEYYVASLLNQSLPGGMAGDAIRAWRMRTSGQGGWKLPAKAVLFERLSGQAAFFVLAACGIVAWPLLMGASEPVRLHSVLPAMLACAVLALIGLMWAIRTNSFHRLASLLPDLQHVFVKDRAWAVQIGLSLVILATYLAIFLLASKAVGASLPLVSALTAIPLALLAMLIPAGLGGWGTREAAAMALWPFLGASAADGLAASLLYGALSLAGAAPGILVLALPGFAAAGTKS
ncbi:lysylphosphatidylglycerol synthase transmembrane domain-containing protein [Rhizobium sp. SL42]|uniref:lysylphosphatidylglycerol synthase transmembrane domain-containing protein n=1 Tax=Rhizobium sp. SL42 TaxID=2806346 RepID=UPI001F18E004|nr:lysylphosphatidylglycerol synthase transmembrane domain-containing protein [Rhizobium sp. SL42]UJW77413.1 flippase-like domain-containing protein [Rhizobium sp. SL42]